MRNPQKEHKNNIDNNFRRKKATRPPGSGGARVTSSSEHKSERVGKQRHKDERESRSERNVLNSHSTA